MYDGNANVVSLVNLADGSVAATYTYSAFGECTATGSQADVCLFHFGGMYWQASAGCYYAKARDYTASLGRFMQRDPIEESGGYNVLAFCGANPINRQDPTGMACLSDKLLGMAVRPGVRAWGVGHRLELDKLWHRDRYLLLVG